MFVLFCNSSNVYWDNAHKKTKVVNVEKRGDCKQRRVSVGVYATIKKGEILENLPIIVLSDVYTLPRSQTLTNCERSREEMGSSVREGELRSPRLRIEPGNVWVAPPTLLRVCHHKTIRKDKTTERT